MVPLTARPAARLDHPVLYHRSSGSSRAPRAAPRASAAPPLGRSGTSSATTSCSLRRSRLASGSSTRQQPGGGGSARARSAPSAARRRTGCRSGSSPNARAPTAREHLVDQVPGADPRASGCPSRCPVSSPQPDEVPGPQRHIRVEQDLLGHVADRRARRARSARRRAPCPPTAAAVRGSRAAAWSCRPVRADQSDEFAGPDGEADVAQHTSRPASRTLHRRPRRACPRCSRRVAAVSRRELARRELLACL